jgi:hypothetical protein
LSTLRRTSLSLGLLLAVAACTPEQSQEVGRIPKKTLDKTATDINKAMQQGQGAERLKEDDK